MYRINLFFLKVTQALYSSSIAQLIRKNEHSIQRKKL